MKSKKKNFNKKPDSLCVTGDAVASAASDLKSLIREHSLFFDKLVELIPARFYLPPDESNQKVWFQGLSKGEKASAKRETRENIKKSRRDRLDPDKASTTGELLRKTLEDQKSVESSEIAARNDGARTLEELRERIRKKRSELAAARAPKAENREKREKRRDFLKGKRKREEGAEEKPRDNTDKRAESVAAEGLAFSHVKLGDDEAKRGKMKKRKLPKAKILERAEKLEEAKKDPGKGGVVEEKESWRTAESRAMGFKVHDKPKLLRQSLKKEKKRQQKSSEKWKERMEGVEKSRAEKQQVRAEHIADRSHQKKMRKIAKREKKLMRPGFEGRKEGFINDS